MQSARCSRTLWGNTCSRPLTVGLGLFHNSHGLPMRVTRRKRSWRRGLYCVRMSLLSPYETRQETVYRSQLCRRAQFLSFSNGAAFYNHTEAYVGSVRAISSSTKASRDTPCSEAYLARAPQVYTRYKLCFLTKATNLPGKSKVEIFPGESAFVTDAVF